VFSLTSEQIHNNFVVTRRVEYQKDGYQRILKKSKVKNIENYLRDIENNYPSILPNSIFVAMDNIEYNDNQKQLTLKDNKDGFKGLIIDGQHRSEGAYEYDSKFPLIVIGVSSLKPKYQARLFITINDTQTSLPKSLYRDLFNLINDEQITQDLLDSDEIDIDLKAVEMAKDLTNDNESALCYIIDMTGEKQVGYVSLMEFIRNVKPYINYDNGKFTEFTFRDQLKIINNYFEAIKTVFNKEWNKDKKPLFKTTVFSGLFKSLGDVWDIVVREEGNFKIENIIKVLEQSNIESLEELASNMGSGFKAQDNYYKKFIKLLKNNLNEEHGRPRIEL
jgi:DGQHR domain-containing protein